MQQRHAGSNVSARTDIFMGAVAETLLVMASAAHRSYVGSTEVECWERAKRDDNDDVAK